MVGKRQHLEEHDNYWASVLSLKYSLPVTPAFQKRLDWILSNVRGSILDCGCNDGTFSIEMARRGHDVVGVDILPRLIARARESALTEGVVDSVRFEVMNIERLKFPRGVFDTVVMTETLEHLIRPRRALKEVAKVLKAEGALLLSVPNGTDAQPTHYNTFNIDGLTRLVEEFFRVEKLTSDFGTIYCIAKKA